MFRKVPGYFAVIGEAQDDINVGLLFESHGTCCVGQHIDVRGVLAHFFQVFAVVDVGLFVVKNGLGFGYTLS